MFVGLIFMSILEKGSVYRFIDVSYYIVVVKWFGEDVGVV